MASLEETLSRAKNLINITSSPTFDKYAKDLKDGGHIDSSALLGEAVPQYVAQPPAQVKSSSPYLEKPYPSQPPANLSNSRLPKQILESIVTEPLDMEQAQALGDPRINALMNKVAEQQPKGKPKLTEYASPQQSQTVQQPIVASNVDYSIIKTLVEDIVRKYSGALKKQILAETKNLQTEQSGGQLKVMKLGENFQFVDSNGDLYEAVLKFKGNIKDKKKVVK